jgi:uncharacterized membrane protein YfcA
MILDVSPLAMAVIAAGFLFAGTVKGTIGAGLPFASIPIVALVVEPAVAVSLTVVPVIATNVWQSFHGGHYREALRRFRFFLLCLIAGVLAGAHFLSTADPGTTKIVLGGVVAAVSLLQLFGSGFSVPQATRCWLDPVVGLGSGVFGGVAGMMVPAVIYMASLRLPKDLLISLFALIALSGTIPLYLTLAANGVLRMPELTASALAMLPALAGLMFGTWVRGRISQQLFERLLFSGLFVLGLSLVYNGVG